MLKVSLQLASLIALVIFLILMAMGIGWELALMRTTISYLGLLIINVKKTFVAVVAKRTKV